MTLEAIIWLIASILWGWLAGYGIATIADHGPIRVPIVTPLVNALANCVERGMSAYIGAVNDVASALDRGVRRLLHLR